MTEDLPPTQYLIMEVLAARYRNGEAQWTFPANLRPAMDQLAQLGLIGWKPGVVEKTIRAWLTAKGCEHSMKPDFETPLIRELHRVASKMRADYVTRNRSIEYICGFEAAADLAESYANAPQSSTRATG